MYMKNKQKLQVFISSTYIDLENERQAAVMAILDSGNIPAGMELFKGGNLVKDTIFKWIDDSDVYMLLLGGRYGSVDEKTRLSYTQLEYEYARKKRKPVFSILLTDEYLSEKAMKQGNDKIYEHENIESYKKFKEKVGKTVVQFANNLDQIERAVIIEIENITNNYDKALVGWIRADQEITNCNPYSLNILEKNARNFLREYMIRNTLDSENAYANIVANNMLKILEFKAILEMVHRDIVIELINDSYMAKITTYRTEKYSYISAGEPYFKLYNEMTKQQADTYEFEKLLIDHANYTSLVNISITKNIDRGQFIYTVASDYIPPEKKKCEISYKSSYICPILDFFQSHRLSYPCGNFSTSVIIKNDSKQQYSILCSTYSSFSKVHYDDFKALEMDNDESCLICLPEWSLPGAGYAIAIKRKSKENHV